MSNLRNEQAWLVTGSLMILATVAASAALYFTKDVMVPFVLAIFIASLVAPLVDYQVVRLRFPQAVAVVVALVLVLVAHTLVAAMLTLASQQVIATAGKYSDNFAVLMRQSIETVERIGIDLDERGLVDTLRSQLPGLISQTFGTALNVLVQSFLVVVFVTFLLAGRHPHQIRRGFYHEIDVRIRRYLGTMVLLAAMMGLAVWGILAWFGLELAPVFGLIAFLLTFVPSVGSVIATLAPLPIAVGQYDSVAEIVGVVAIPGALQIIVGNTLQPKLVGEGLDLHPVTILLSLAFWGLLWGPIGMVLAVPIMAVARIVLMRFESTAPLGRLLAGVLPTIRGDADRGTPDVPQNRGEPSQRETALH
jgi:AI-2 transport protein TqsA